MEKHRLKTQHLAVIIVFIIGTAIRLFFTPFSTGSDIPQFLSFANTMARHGFCFYMYATGEQWVEEQWSYPWPYVYSPFWVIVLYILKLIANGTMKISHTNSLHMVKVSTSWIIAVKSILIISDIIVALIIYKLSRKASYTTLYYLNPVTIYNSSIYGMFDNIALMLLMSSLYCFRKRKQLSMVFLGSAVALKQTILLASLPLLLKTWILTRRSKTNLAKYVSLFLLPFIVITGPFLLFCPGSWASMVKCLTMPATIYYTEPICYSFNGVSSLATYIHKVYDVETIYVLKVLFIFFAVMSIVMLYRLIFLLKRNVETWVLCYCLYLIFPTFYWRVNYQYFVPVVGLGCLALGKVKAGILRTLILATIIYPSLWFFMFPITFWFYVHLFEPNIVIIRWLSGISLNIYCDHILYIIYSLGLTVIYFLTLLLISVKTKELKIA